ncbi:M20 aminoacylase family protein [Silvimonas soli]|uniref:M20 aminoacylase family protein n=1 Tax=Silvimonas soli TaxID=2980100 RepID=UPI0024B32E26|nr:M20 aminoacylase family protein [Silvimonas soli]
MLQSIRSFEPELIEIRRTIHRHPELGFEEVQTSDLVASKLASWGYEVHRGLAKTGVVGVLKAGTVSKTLGLRADMDALPIHEASAKPWSSQVPNRMHACGHDGHTTMLLGAARYLAQTRAFNGTLNLIFQPAEEALGGAESMVQAGLFDRFPCDALFGMHNMPGLPVGQFYFRSGAFMASADSLLVTITGRGGHGALPHTTVDPVVVAASITLALQTIVSRNIDTQQAAVITVGSIQAGDVANVIPGQAIMKLSVRALDRQVRKTLLERIGDVVRLQAQSFGATASIETQHGTPVLINDETQTRFAHGVAASVFGDEAAHYGARPLMGSEDFAYMLEANPNGCYFFIGNGDGAGSCMIHNPGYDFNDGCLTPGATMWAALAEAYLK